VKVVDSCGWLEHIANGTNAAFFSPLLQDEADLLVPGLVVYEVSRRMIVWGQDAALQKVLKVMKRLSCPDLGLEQLHQAAVASNRYKLHMADAIIWQTAQVHRATLYTQDAALQGLPGVIFQAKPTAQA
jgi:predicted nucleic acid-binding protein